LDVNDGFTRLLGYSQEEVIGESSFVLNIWNDFKDREILVSGLKKNGLVEFGIRVYHFHFQFSFYQFLQILLQQ